MRWLGMGANASTPWFSLARTARVLGAGSVEDSRYRNSGSSSTHARGPNNADDVRKVTGYRDRTASHPPTQGRLVPTPTLRPRSRPIPAGDNPRPSTPHTGYSPWPRPCCVAIYAR